MSDPAAGQGIRLNRFLASCGFGSRRNCETLITEGRVQVNGEVITSFGVRVQPDDHVRVDGRIARPENEITILLNKPKGYLCTKHDPDGRKTIYELLPAKFGNLNYVGRLDRQSQGLILLTNSGELNQQLTHPSHQVEKEYLVGLNRAFNTPVEAPKLIEGIPLHEGLAKAKSVTSLGARRVSVILTQGYNRQIRRMFAKLEFKVKSLERVRIGSLTAPELSTGDYRVVGKRELDLAGRNP